MLCTGVVCCRDGGLAKPGEEARPVPRNHGLAVLVVVPVLGQVAPASWSGGVAALKLDASQGQGWPLAGVKIGSQDWTTLKPSPCVWFLVSECGDEAVEGVPDQQQPGVGGVTLHPRHLRAQQRRGDLPQLAVRLAAPQQVQTVQERN